MIEIHSLSEAESCLDGITAVIFDLDDTLYPEKDYVRSGFKAAAALFPEVPDMAEKLWTAFEKGLPAFDTVLAGEGLIARKEEAIRAYRFQTPDICLYPDAKEFASNLPEIIITDGRPEGQRAKIAALGLADAFDEIIVTDELGGTEFRKPNPEAFELMSRRLGVPFGEMAYVGDNIKKDFIAPDRLGMRSIRFLNPDGLYK